VMRTADAVSGHSFEQLALTLAIFVVVYLLVFGAGTAYLLRIIGKGPSTGESSHPVDGGPGHMRQPMRPLSAAPERLDPAPVSPREVN
jgi:cytochrome d ubiquinol oxidase subunit I